MTNQYTTLGVVGTDGIVPVYDPTARWCWWNIDEIYQGQQGENRYVPKVGDFVMDTVGDGKGYLVYEVVSLDLITLIPTLRLRRPGGLSYVEDETDILIDNGPETFRCYVDITTTPYTMTVDQSLMVGGSLNKYAKIFRGHDISASGDVISRLYDASGNFLGNTIPLELVRYNSHDNYAVKTVPTCSTLVQMPDNERLTLVIYDDEGHVTYKRILYVENTSFIRQAFAEERYITGISLKCPFLSQSTDSVLEFPLNVPITALNLIGVVHYSTGETLELPVDGSKFSVHGLEHFTSTIVGQKVDLVLSYTLSESEAVYGAVTSDSKYITEPYSLVTVQPNNSYTVKIFGYPEWINQYEGYQMRYYMLNLDRNIITDVTSHVSFAENTGAFHPTLYGVVQRKAIKLTLSDVSGAYRNFIHTQLLDILLRGQAHQTETPWEVTQEVNGDRGLYGFGLRADRDFNFHDKFTISSSALSYEEWLDRVYYKTYPLVNPLTEVRPPVPTHFEVMYQGHTARYPITAWNSQLSLDVDLELHKNIYIKFIKVGVTGDMVLSVAGMIVKA